MVMFVARTTKNKSKPDFHQLQGRLLAPIIDWCFEMDEVAGAATDGVVVVFVATTAAVAFFSIVSIQRRRQGG